VDARARLRRYLEQRREAGEAELVLDSLTVDDVMRLLGAAGAASPADSETNDWRAALRDVPERSAAPTTRLSPPAEARVPIADAPIAEQDRAPTPPIAPDEPLPASPPPAGGRRAEFPSAAQTGAPAIPESHATMPLERVPSGIVIGGARNELFDGPMSGLPTLDDLARAVAACTRCGLYKTAKNPVPGEGNPRAGLMCVGEAPGAVEDETSRPFVGPAGQLLDKILLAVKLSRGDVYICNVLKHRPPGNRNPMPDEVEACSPYLLRQIELIGPKVIIVCGADATEHEGTDRQAARKNSSLLRCAAGGDVPSSGIAPESRVETPDVGRCPACSTTPRSRRQ
jgi:DNA polymerase